MDPRVDALIAACHSSSSLLTPPPPATLPAGASFCGESTPSDHRLGWFDRLLTRCGVVRLAVLDAYLGSPHPPATVGSRLFPIAFMVPVGADEEAISVQAKLFSLGCRWPGVNREYLAAPATAIGVNRQGLLSWVAVGDDNGSKSHGSPLKLSAELLAPIASPQALARQLARLVR